MVLFPPPPSLCMAVMEMSTKAELYPSPAKYEEEKLFYESLSSEKIILHHLTIHHFLIWSPTLFFGKKWCGQLPLTHPLSFFTLCSLLDL